MKEVQMKPLKEGQALAEFTLVLPILTLILLAVYMVGAAMYTGANASTALRAALQTKSTYADSENALGDFKTQVNAYNTGSFQIQGQTVDSIQVQKTDRETAVLVGRKAVDFPMFPTFNFVVTQGITTSLINNNAGKNNPSTTLPYDTAYPLTAATIDPAAYQVTIPPPVVPMDSACTPDLTVFDPAETTQGQTLFQANLDPAIALDACNTTPWHTGTGVTFSTRAPKY